MVSINGESRGVTPLDLQSLLWGNYQVTIDQKGYTPHVETVTLSEAAPQAEVKVTLSRTPPVPGSAEVVSVPAGAAVKVDGTPSGQTPLSIPRVRPGSHRVELAKEGYEPWTGTMVVQPGGRARVEAQLREIPKPSPSPVAAGPDLTRVFTETEVDTPPKKTAGRSAAYPSSAPPLKRGQRASVTVSFVVTEKGEVTDLQVLESGGAALDESVLTALKTWKFSPGVKHGTKVKVKLSRRHTFLGG
jgi:TonB family protein